MKKFIISVASVVYFANVLHAQTTWTLDKSHTKLGFKIMHLMLSEVEGDFKTYDVKISAKDESFTDATVEANIDVNSINTDQSDRDAHLKRDDMFDAAKYPTITFKSKSFKKVGDKQFDITGDLTIKGVTKPVKLEATLTGVVDHPFTKKKVAGFKFTTSFKRTDFGVGNGTPSAIVGENVVISGSMEFFKD